MRIEGKCHCGNIRYFLDWPGGLDGSRLGLVGAPFAPSTVEAGLRIVTHNLSRRLVTRPSSRSTGLGQLPPTSLSVLVAVRYLS